MLMVTAVPYLAVGTHPHRPPGSDKSGDAHLGEAPLEARHADLAGRSCPLFPSATFFQKGSAYHGDLLLVHHRGVRHRVGGSVTPHRARGPQGTSRVSDTKVGGAFNRYNRWVAPCTAYDRASAVKE